MFRLLCPQPRASARTPLGSFGSSIVWAGVCACKLAPLICISGGWIRRRIGPFATSAVVRGDRATRSQLPIILIRKSRIFNPSRSQLLPLCPLARSQTSSALTELGTNQLSLSRSCSPFRASGSLNFWPSLACCSVRLRLNLEFGWISSDFSLIETECQDGRARGPNGKLARPSSDSYCYG